MPVLVICKFDKDPINNERASEETSFSSYKSMRNCSGAQGCITEVNGPKFGRDSNSSEVLCLSWIFASLTKIRLKMTEKIWRHHFPHYNSIGGFGCHDNHSFDQTCFKI